MTLKKFSDFYLTGSKFRLKIRLSAYEFCQKLASDRVHISDSSGTSPSVTKVSTPGYTNQLSRWWFSVWRHRSYERRSTVQKFKSVLSEKELTAQQQWLSGYVVHKTFPQLQRKDVGERNSFGKSKIVMAMEKYKENKSCLKDFREAKFT